jgi:Glyoxalase/Bleomycin resistance protein/Dioxygenase superfamily
LIGSTVALAVRQLAYKVNDLEAAAQAHHRRFGSGPFFVLRHVALSSSLHRDVERPFDHSSAYGQWGDKMIELVVQHNPDPSALHEMFPYGSGIEGLHHAALFVDDLEGEIARFQSEGAPLAQLSVTEGGTAFAFVDTRESLGHMLELYEPTPQLAGFYDFVADAAKGWDGRNVVQELG